MYYLGIDILCCGVSDYHTQIRASDRFKSFALREKGTHVSKDAMTETDLRDTNFLPLNFT
jgi:hypothetical protein